MNSVVASLGQSLLYVVFTDSLNGTVHLISSISAAETQNAFSPALLLISSCHDPKYGEYALEMCQQHGMHVEGGCCLHWFCNYDKRLRRGACRHPHTAVPCDCSECKAEHQEEAGVDMLYKFYVFLVEAGCTDGNKQRALFFKSKSTATSGLLPAMFVCCFSFKNIHTIMHAWKL